MRTHGTNPRSPPSSEHHSIDMSQILKDENDLSVNRLNSRVDYQLSAIQEIADGELPREDQPPAPSLSEEMRSQTTDTFNSQWLKSMGAQEGTASFTNMMRFLDAIGVSEFEDLQALATSFEDIVGMIGGEHTPITLMKLRNYLWHATGLPSDMQGETTITSMMALMRGNEPNPSPQKQPPSYQNVMDGGPHEHAQPPLPHGAHAGTRRRRSDFYHAGDMVYQTPNRVREDPDATSWGILPPLTSAKDDQYRRNLLDDVDAPIDPYAANLTA